MKQIVILDSGYRSYDYEHDLFREYGYSLIIHEGTQGIHDGKFELAQQAEGILVRDTPVRSPQLDMMPNLKAIVRYGVGYDNIDVESAKSRGIRVANVQGYGNHSVSDHAMALMFACVRNLEQSKKGTFARPQRPDVFELHDKVLGIIGFGRIGSHFSRKASTLFNKSLAYDPYQSAEFIQSWGAEKVELSTLLKKSHVISIHCNLTEETRHILNRGTFGKMGNRPVIINTARGAVIHEEDILDALQSNIIHSAGLDVFETEPPGDNQKKLFEHPRIIATPHIAWYSESSSQILQKRAADNLLALLTGELVEDEL